MEMKNRRKLVHGMTAVGIASTPIATWICPVVESVVLPAHAETSSPTPVVPQLEQRAVNTPPRGEDISVDMQFLNRVSYDMSEHLSDDETPSSELALFMISLPDLGVLEMIGMRTFQFELLFNPQNVRSTRFEYQVQDPEGARSETCAVEIINLPMPGPM